VVLYKKSDNVKYFKYYIFIMKNKRTLFFLICLVPSILIASILLVLSITKVRADSPILIITEFSRTWVEIKNISDSPADPALFGFGCSNLEDNVGEGGPLTDTNGDVLATSIPADGIIWMPLLCSDLSLTYPEGKLTVRAINDSSSDSVTYGNSETSAVALPGEYQSASLYNGKWSLTDTPSKGTENPATELTISSASTIFRSGKNNWDVQKTKYTTVGDYNADGEIEVAMMYDYGGGDMAIIIFKKNGNDYEPLTALRTGAGNWNVSSTKSLISADFDNDGRDEVGSMYDYGGGDMALIVFE
jgi:hypothetical protein